MSARDQWEYKLDVAKEALRRIDQMLERASENKIGQRAIDALLKNRKATNDKIDYAYTILNQMNANEMVDSISSRLNPYLPEFVPEHTPSRMLGLTGADRGAHPSRMLGLTGADRGAHPSRMLGLTGADRGAHPSRMLGLTGADRGAHPSRMLGLTGADRGAHPSRLGKKSKKSVRKNKW